MEPLTYSATPKVKTRNLDHEEEKTSRSERHEMEEIEM